MTPRLQAYTIYVNKRYKMYIDDIHTRMLAILTATQRGVYLIQVEFASIQLGGVGLVVVERNAVPAGCHVLMYHVVYHCTTWYHTVPRGISLYHVVYHCTIRWYIIVSRGISLYHVVYNYTTWYTIVRVCM